MVTSVAMGNILAIIINTFLITKFGVRFAFLIPGAITLILGLAVLITAKEIKLLEIDKAKHISMLSMIKNKQVLSMGVPAVFHGVMKENISLWMAVYIVDKYCVDLSTSSYYILLIPFIGFIGRTVYPGVYRLCKNRENVVSFAGFAVCIVSSILLCIKGINITIAMLSLSAIYAAVSMINTSILSIFPLHFVKTGNVASISGVMDFATYLGTGISSMIFGVLIEGYGYGAMFAIWALLCAAALLMQRKK